MIEDEPGCRELLADLRAVILRLSLISHAPSQPFNPAPPPEDLKHARRNRLKLADPIMPHMGPHHSHGGTSRLPGRDTLPHDDAQVDYRQKSATYFKKKLEKWERDKKSHGAADLEALLKEAERAHSDWLRRPLVDGQAPAIADPEWKRYIAACGRDSGELARQFSVSRQYINRIKAGDWSEFREKETPQDELERKRREWERRRAIPERAAC